MPKPTHSVLCDLSAIPDPGACGFELNLDNELLGILVVRRGDQVWGYRNRCPHTGVPLEWFPDRFLDVDSRFIQCATHGALFTFETGKCLWGPCQGQSLESVKLEVRQGSIVFVSGPKTQVPSIEPPRRQERQGRKNKN